ncbi:methionine synthase [Serinicoccus kebangsaanensis]|uniref:methionine synthase n=1 Tax=Serinicoccus kebangsaanensis TaxID=2602069 RepID=UPI00124DE1ED|nr:methionine synthase [Serinicoccus kebangsaanensis]
MVDVSGIGSWPGTDVREALRVIRGELASGATPEGVRAIPYLPELPARGPGADIIGRAAHLLVDLPVDLQPQGWRLVDRPGRDAERTSSLSTEDLDELAEAYDGYAGPLKVQVGGPWTLASSLWRPLGDRVLDDRGATRDVVDSLTEGVGAYLARVQALVPGAELVLQVDEPSLGAVLAGRVRSESGYRVLRTPDRGEVVAALRQVLHQPVAQLAGVHCCAGDPPVDVLHDAGAGFVAVDLAQVGRERFEQVAVAVEAGARLWAGLDVDSTDPAEPLLRRWREAGLPAAALSEVGATPPCGLASADPDQALRATRTAVQTALRLAESSAA